MINLFGKTFEEIVVIFKEENIPPFRIKQIQNFIYKHHIYDFTKMHNLGDKLIKQLQEKFCISLCDVVTFQRSKSGDTTKFLLEFADGIKIETVLMEKNYGNSVCISTQAGCNIGCTFCASTLKGCVRNLTKEEMLAQVMFCEELLKKQNKSLTNIVIMGSGEPMLNYDNVLEFLHLIHKDYTLNFSYRNISLSTSGIVDGIYKLAAENIPLTLCISLHAPNNLLRSKIMPINRKYNIEEVLKAAKHYAKITKRRVTYEYILIDKVNDNQTEAEELVHLLKDNLCNVNLIPINPILEKDYQRPSKNRIKYFNDYLNKHGINSTIRREMGTDIDAACGQLRSKYIKEGR